MARRLTLGLLGALVVAGHVLALEWISRQADAISGLDAMAQPMFTRLLKPATPPPVARSVAAAAPLPKPRVHAAGALPPASAPKQAAKKKPPEPPPPPELALPAPPPEPQAEPVLAQAPVPPPLPPEPAASAPSPSASAALAAASAPMAAASGPDAARAAAIARWPADTRLTYRLSGEWRSGPLFGDARVQWQREGEKYQVRLDVKIQVFGTQVLTSQGEVTPEGLLPRAYEELRPGKRRVAQLGDQVVMLENGSTVPRPPGVQDTASQFVELAQRFATGREVLAVGRTVTVWLARPGGVDQWTYDVVAREMLRTPSLGEVEAFHLKPRTLDKPRGNITAEMWFAPSLQYLPVKIRVIMGSEAYLDLLVDHIEQR